MRATLLVLALLWAAPDLAAAQSANIGDMLGAGGEGGASEASAPATSGDSAARLQAAARRYERAIGLLVAVLPQKDGEFRTHPLGTVWAFAPNLLGTNSHVSALPAQWLPQGVDFFVLPNRGRGESFRVTRAFVHPRFNESKPNAYGALPSGIPYDVGVIEIEGSFPETVTLARPETLENLESGEPVAFLGFPMEGLANDNVNVANPIATMQTGIITSMSDYYLTDSGPEGNLLIRHNLPSTGGASGSPVFNADGEVIGAHNASNKIGQVVETPDGLEVRRATSAAMVNYAQRIDILYDLVEFESVAEASQPNAAAPQGAAVLPWASQ